MYETHFQQRKYRVAGRPNPRAPTYKLRKLCKVHRTVALHTEVEEFVDKKVRRHARMRADGEGKHVRRRNKKERDFTHPFIHKSKLLNTARVATKDHMIFDLFDQKPFRLIKSNHCFTIDYTLLWKNGLISWIEMKIVPNFTRFWQSLLPINSKMWPCVI